MDAIKELKFLVKQIENLEECEMIFGLSSDQKIELRESKEKMFKIIKEL